MYIMTNIIFEQGDKDLFLNINIFNSFFLSLIISIYQISVLYPFEQTLLKFCQLVLVIMTCKGSSFQGPQGLLSLYNQDNVTRRRRAYLYNQNNINRRRMRRKERKNVMSQFEIQLFFGSSF